jgi:phage baseplate assembly protein W
MPDLVLDKYGCRVAQILIQKVNPELVKRIVETLSGYEVRICLDKNGTHVVECLLDHHVNYVYESFFYVVSLIEITFS